MLVLLVTGSLGSGKTTLVKKLLESGALNISDVYYVVNDVGAVNLDSSKVDVENKIALSAGCVCCEDIHSLAKTLDSLLQKEIKWVIVEPSGISTVDTLSSLLNFKNIPFIEIRVINLDVDPESRMLQNQPAGIFLTRCDSQKYNNLLAQYPNLPLHLLHPDKHVSADVFRAMMTEQTSPLLHSSGLVEETRDPHHHNAIINVLVRPERIEDFLSLLKSLIEADKVIRAKGFFSDQAFDVVSRQIDQVKFSAPIDLIGKVLIIGKSDISFALSEFVTEFEQEQLRSEINRLLKIFPSHNQTSDGSIMVASDCDRAYFMALDLLEPEEKKACLEAAVQKIATWRLRSLGLIIEGSHSASPDQINFWRHSIYAALGYLIVLHPESLGDSLIQQCLSVHPFEGYFSTMLALSKVHEINFTPPFKHVKKPWGFWLQMIEGGVQYGELTRNWASDILRSCVILRDFDPQMEEANTFFSRLNTP